jgi:Transposase
MRGEPGYGEEGSYRRGDSAGAEGSGIGRDRGRGLPEAWDSQQSFYLWKKKYAGLGVSELRELRQLRDENSKLKRLVADLSLDRHILQEIVAKKL